MVYPRQCPLELRASAKYKPVLRALSVSNYKRKTLCISRALGASVVEDMPRQHNVERRELISTKKIYHPKNAQEPTVKKNK